MKKNPQLEKLLREIQRLPATLHEERKEKMSGEIQKALFEKFDACHDTVYQDSIWGGEDKESIKRKYKKEISKYREICKSYKKGNIGKALELMQDVLKSNKQISTFSLQRGHDLLFRVRKNEDYQLYGRAEMFHMPLNMVSEISNQRYSINGFPCLYLGASIYDCWEECRRPDIERLNVVAYKYVGSKPLKFLLIDYPKDISGLLDYKNVVLFLHCSYFSKNDEDKHKAEYVIPELLLHSLIAMRDHKAEGYDPRFDFDGIAYLSSRFFKPSCLFPNNHDLMMNYVIPIRGNKAVKIGEKKKGNEYDADLMEMFHISAPKAIFTERILGTDAAKFHPRPTGYVNSLFHRMELQFLSTDCEFERLK